LIGSRDPYLINIEQVLQAAREGGYFLELNSQPERYWDFPKEIVNPGEDPWVAALRELQEETGLKDVNAVWGKEYFETQPYSHRKIARYYLTEVFQSDVKLRMNPEHGKVEHHEFRWLSYESASKLLVPRVRAALEWAENFCKRLEE
jgi:bis(5'-nucleosidyl)-tetraphosphatase